MQLRRSSLLLALLGALAVSLATTAPVAACSANPSIQDMATSAPVIAIGTFADPGEHVVTLVVEAYLTGQQPTRTLLINNHGFGVTDRCELLLGTGWRFPAGQRVLAFLEPDDSQVGADWRPTGLAASHIIVIPADEQLAFNEPLGSLALVKAQIRAAIGGQQPTRLPRTADTQHDSIWLLLLGCISLVIGAGMLVERRRMRNA